MAASRTAVAVAETKTPLGLYGRNGFLFPTVLEEKENRPGATACHLIRSCLRKAGVSKHGLDSLQLHSALFQHVFLTDSNKDCPESAKNGDDKDSNADFCFSSEDYFSTLIDPSLEWFGYYRKMLPFMRLPFAVNVADAVDKFCEKYNLNQIILPERETGGKDDVMVVTLATSVAELSCSIIMDLLYGTEVDCDKVMSSEFLSCCEHLSIRTVHCLQVIFDLLDQESLQNVVEKNASVLKYLVEVFALVLCATNPLTQVENVSSVLKDLLVRKAKCDKGKEENCTETTTTTGSASERRGKVITIKRFKKDVERKSEELSATDSNSDETLKTDNDTSSSSESGTMTELNATENNSNRVRDESVAKRQSSCLIVSLRKALPLNLLIKIVRFFARGEDKSQKYFYQSLSSIIESDEKVVSMGRHKIGRGELFLCMEEALQLLTQKAQNKKEKGTDLGGCGSLSLSVGNCSSEQWVVECSRLDLVYPERKKFNVSPAQERLSLGQQLSGQEDLTFLRKAIDERIAGWYDLFTLGFQNHDFENWWNQGFYDLVKSHDAIVSTESNIRHLLTVLVNLSLERPIHWEHVESITKLFANLLEKLPVLLQERVILSGPILKSVSEILPEGEKRVERSSNCLFHLLGEDGVRKQTTQLLNRLTTDTVHQFLSHVLLLCLYSKEVVVTQSLTAAVQNKGQVDPVVQLLRQIPNICSTLYDGKSFLMTCLTKVLVATEWDEKSEGHAALLISQLAQDYTHALDFKGLQDTSNYQMNGILSLNEVMELIVIPAFDNQFVTDFNPPLPISATLECLSRLIASTDTKNTPSLHGIVLVQALANLCVKLMPRISYEMEEMGVVGVNRELDEQNGKEEVEGSADEVSKKEGESGRGWNPIYQSARNCLSQLMDKMGGNQDRKNVKWLLHESHRQGGLMAVALVYPLVQQVERLSMETILRTLVDSAPSVGVCTVMLMLLSAGQLNEAMCAAVMQVTDKDTVDMLGVTKHHFVSVLAQVLYISCSSDMPRTCLLIRQFVRVMDSGHDCYKDWEEILPCVDWSAADKDCVERCLCIQYLSDALLWLLSGKGRKLNSQQTTTAVTNYQAGCQMFLDKSSKESNKEPNNNHHHQSESDSTPQTLKDHVPNCTDHQPNLIIQLHALVHCCYSLQVLTTGVPAPTTASTTNKQQSLTTAVKVDESPDNASTSTTSSVTESNPASVHFSSSSSTTSTLNCSSSRISNSSFTIEATSNSNTQQTINSSPEAPPSPSPQTQASIQTLNVLAMSILNSITTIMEERRDSKVKEKMRTVKDESTSAVLDKEKVLYLRDVVVTCVAAQVIRQQLTKQLHQVWAVLPTNK